MKNENKNTLTDDKRMRVEKTRPTDETVRVWLENRFCEEQAILCDRLREEAAGMGITRTQFKRIRRAMGIKTWHQFDGDGATANWFWVYNMLPLFGDASLGEKPSEAPRPSDDAWDSVNKSTTEGCRRRCAEPCRPINH